MPDFNKQQEERLHAAAPELVPELVKELYYALGYVVEAHGTATNSHYKSIAWNDIQRIEALLARIDGKELPAMTQTLKRCPFCGGSAKIFYNNDKEHTCYIECRCCFIRTDDYYDKKYLVEDWNRRYSVN